MATQDYSVFEPEIWSPKVFEFFKERLVAARVFTDDSGSVMDGGDIIHYPKIADNHSVNDINVTSGDLTAQNITDTGAALTIDKWKGAKQNFTDFQLAQVKKSYRIRERYARNMAYKVAHDFDDNLLQVAGDNVDNTIGDSATALTSTNLELAIEILESNAVPTQDMRFILHPRMFYGDVFKRQKYYDASQFGQANLPDGTIGRLYGIPVARTPQIRATNGSRENLLVHPELVYYAIGAIPGMSSAGPRITVDRSSESLRWNAKVDLMFGSAAIRTEAGVSILAQDNR